MDFLKIHTLYGVMTVNKAMKLLEFLIEYETKIHDAMSDPSKSWNVGNDSI